MKLSDLEKNYTPIQVSQTPQQPSTQGRGGFLTSLISETAGTGGALGGAALGASLGSVVPGIGTVIGGGIGGLLGGFAGGGVGAAAEQKIRDDEVRGGDVLSEALLSGAFGAFGGAGRGVQAVRGAGKAAQGASKVGKAAQASDDLLAKARGITPGVGKTSTRAGLSTSEAARLNKVATDLGVNKLTPKANLEVVESVKSGLFQQRDDILRQAGSLPKGTIAKIKGNIDDVVRKTPGINSLDEVAPDLAKLSNQRSVSGLTQFRQGIDDLINFNRASATPDPKMDRLYKTIRSSIDKELGKVNKDLKQVNTVLKDVYSLEDLFQESTKRQIAGTGSMRIPFAQTRLPGGSTQALQTVGSRVAGAPGAIGASTGARATRALAPGIIGRGVAGAEAPQPQPELGLEDALIGVTGSMGVQQQPVEQSPYPRENLLYDIQRDPANADEYIQQYQVFQEIFGTPEQPKLTQTQQQFQNNAVSALQDIGNIRQELAQDPGVSLRAAIPGGSLAERLTGTTGFEAARRNVVDSIARLRSGAAITEDEARRYAALLPSTFDSPEDAMEKLDRLEQLLSSFANPVPASESVLEEAMLRAQGAL